MFVRTIDPMRITYSQLEARHLYLNKGTESEPAFLFVFRRKSSAQRLITVSAWAGYDWFP